MGSVTELMECPIRWDCASDESVCVSGDHESDGHSVDSQLGWLIVIPWMLHWRSKPRAVVEEVGAVVLNLVKAVKIGIFARFVNFFCLRIGNHKINHPSRDLKFISL